MTDSSAARQWSLEQTARAFLVTSATIASWLARVDEQGPQALVQLPVPVNRFPDFVRYLVQQLKSVCPCWTIALNPNLRFTMSDFDPSGTAPIP